MRASSPDRVFSALADSTRRGILELLLEQRTLTAGEIAARFPTITRPAVSKHLRVLREARLVSTEERGREHHYALDPRPLASVQREWLDRFVPLWDASLERLKHAAERPRPSRTRQ